MMDSTVKKRSFSQCFFGEFSWGIKFCWALALLICVDIGATRDEGLWFLVVNGGFNSVFLLFILGYLSDFRYRFVKESRNN